MEKGTIGRVKEMTDWERKVERQGEGEGMEREKTKPGRMKKSSKVNRGPRK